MRPDADALSRGLQPTATSTIVDIEISTGSMAAKMVRKGWAQTQPAHGFIGRRSKLGDPWEMLLDSYKAFRAAIGRATALELAGVIHLASERLRMLTSAPQMQPVVAVVGETHTVATVPTEVCIYLAGASGLKDRAREIGKPICKIGTTSRGDAHARIDDLSKIRYGGHDPLAGGHRQGFDDYRLTPFRRPAEALPPAVRLSDGCLWVQLPQGASRGAFECRFRALMKGHAVEHWSQTSDGLRYLAERGLQRGSLPVSTWHAHGAVRAKELYCLPLGRSTMAAALAADAALKGFQRL